MYDMLSARVNRLIGKMDLLKKTPETAFFKRKKIGISSLWEDLEAKLLTPGQDTRKPLEHSG